MSETAHTLQGLTVASFESRLSKKMGKLIERTGATPLLAPSMRELPLEDNPAAFDFFEKLQADTIDYLIFMTGVGLRTLVACLETKFPRAEILKAFEKTKIVVRGPKPEAVCTAFKIPMHIKVPAPNTWHEIIDTLEVGANGRSPLQGQTIAIQEYGLSNRTFIEELEERGAQVLQVPVYKWGLPEDMQPLENAIEKISAGEVDIALFTNAYQVDNLLNTVGANGRSPLKGEARLRRGFYQTLIASIGPTCTERLRDAQLFPDLEASPNKMDELVDHVARDGRALLENKRTRWKRCRVRVSESQRAQQAAPLQDNVFLSACRGEPNERPPIWLMRQAGRYMAEYQMIRRNIGFLDLCKRPDLAAEVTIGAVERLGVDAAIIFSDILVVLEPMGLKVSFEKGHGPKIANPLQHEADILSLQKVDVHQSLGFVADAIRIVRKEMKAEIPLIGFCGAPFTLASYMIEGRGSRDYTLTKKMMRENALAWNTLMAHLADYLCQYLRMQIDAGCGAVQIFDSWVGCLSQEEYRKFVFPYTKQLVFAVKKHVPVIHFGTHTGHLLDDIKETGCQVMGLDWRVPLAKTWDHLGNVMIQGNMDPRILLTDKKTVCQEAKKILAAVGGRPGFIFNLGHGILPQTPVDNVMALVDFVSSYSSPQPTEDGH